MDLTFSGMVGWGQAILPNSKVSVVCLHRSLSSPIFSLTVCSKHLHHSRYALTVVSITRHTLWCFSFEHVPPSCRTVTASRSAISLSPCSLGSVFVTQCMDYVLGNLLSPNLEALAMTMVWLPGCLVYHTVNVSSQMPNVLDLNHHCGNVCR